MAADPKSVNVEALKSAFKEGATPNEKDYHTLIDLAAVGGKALGGDNKTTPTLRPGDGLEIAEGKLAVKVKTDAGVTLDGSGLAVKGDGKTVTVTAAGVGIKVKTNGGLESNTTDGLHVKTGPGLRTDKNGLEITLAEHGGLKADNGGLAVQVAAGAGLEIDAKTGLQVKLKAGKDNYIESTDAGLALTNEGVKAIEAALKKVSLEALKTAVKNTGSGEHEPNPVLTSEVEKEIAKALRDAYKTRADKQKLCDKISLEAKARPAYPIDLRKQIASTSTVPHIDKLYFIPGENKPEDWAAIVTENGLTPEGVLRLSNARSGTINLVGVYMGTGTEYLVKTVDVTVLVRLTDVAEVSPKREPGLQYIPQSGLDISAMWTLAHPDPGVEYRLIRATAHMDARVNGKFLYTNGAGGEVEIEAYPGMLSEKSGTYGHVAFPVGKTIVAMVYGQRGAGTELVCKMTDEEGGQVINVECDGRLLVQDDGFNLTRELTIQYCGEQVTVPSKGGAYGRFENGIGGVETDGYYHQHTLTRGADSVQLRYDGSKRLVLATRGDWQWKDEHRSNNGWKTAKLVVGTSVLFPRVFRTKIKDYQIRIIVT